MRPFVDRLAGRSAFRSPAFDGKCETEIQRLCRECPCEYKTMKGLSVRWVTFYGSLRAFP
ncbi:unnamed protein product [Soboliphyme baturini]|uniref:Transposase n=1 Tax=Soboliphyme baturini TaxID=241478 RepID=A0A183IA34_9BILA|nr:unnamed protein product [Soboliphyme baturini]